MTGQQQLALGDLLFRLKPSEFHHGDCVGADDEAATLAATASLPPRIVSHPPSKKAMRAYNRFAKETREEKDYFVRNRDIVDETDQLIACPLQEKRQATGGTWYTVNYAAKLGKVVWFIWPNGKVERQ